MKQKIEGGKSEPEVKSVLVTEWFTQEKDGLVYLNWKFQDGRTMKRLTPFEMIPIVELKLPKDYD